MSRIANLAANRIAPWRGADWRVLIVEGALLVLGGAAWRLFRKDS